MSSTRSDPYGAQGEAELLAGAYRSSLELAAAEGVRRLAFPNISTGIHGYPKAEAARSAIATVKSFLNRHVLPEHIIFCCFDTENASLYRSGLESA